MAAPTAVASLLNNIDQIMNHPHLSTSLDEKQIQPLVETAGSLLDFIEGYNYGGVVSKEIEDLERRIASAAYAAEDVIESHIVDQIQAGYNQASLSCSLHLQQTIEDMDAIMIKANELKEKEGLRDEQPTHSRPLIESGESVMVGFDDELIQLMDELTNQRSSRHIISIVGMGGMVFKEDSEIRVSKIIKLWVAEGFVRPKEAHILEEVGESYLKELIDRNLILVSKHRHNAKVGSCGIHDLLRDLCLKVAEQQQFFHVTDGQIQGTERRLICFNWHSLLHNRPLLARSILSRRALGQPVDRKLLRVWDEGHLETESEFDVNANLRYLAYEPVFHLQPAWKLSASVSFVWNLQTLIIEQFSSPTVVAAPIEIWKMCELKHVKCAKIYLPDPPPSGGFFILDNLQTLTTAVNLRKCVS